MDIEITGVTQEMMRSALEQAKRGPRAHLDRTLKAIPEVRTELSSIAPRIATVQIDPEQIGMVDRQGRRDDSLARDRAWGGGRDRGARRDDRE